VGGRADTQLKKENPFLSYSSSRGTQHRCHPKPLILLSCWLSGAAWEAQGKQAQKKENKLFIFNGLAISFSPSRCVTDSDAVPLSY
jgi:hypothetical protein